MGYLSLLLISFVWLLVKGDGFNITCPQKPKTLPNLIMLGLPNQGCIKGTDGSSCEYFIRMAPNLNDSDFLDIYMEGNLKGWVAVGFSRDTFMVNTDVLGCKQDESGNMGIINGWNPDVKPKHNERDPNQHGMCLYSIEYKDKRIICSFSRYRFIMNNGYDYNLSDSFHLLLGKSESQTPLNESLPFHSPESPVPTLSKFNPYNYNPNNSNGTVDNAKFKRRLLRVHGSLMVIAWPLFAITAIFFAAWMKPSLPKLWFQFHRALMLLSLLTVSIAFISAFVANKNNPTPGLLGFECPREIWHFTFGILVMGLMIINPLIGLIRCKLNSPNRWIFNLIHGSGIGTITTVLALINIGLGMAQYQSSCLGLSRTRNYILWVYLGWLVFTVVYQVILYGIFTLIALQSHGEERYKLAPSFVRPILARFGQRGYIALNDPEDKSAVVSKDSEIRVAALGIYSSVTSIVVVILVVLISVDS